MTKFFKSVVCVVSAYALLLVPYMIYFVMSVTYDAAIGMQMDHTVDFWPTYSSFFWSAFVGVVLCCVCNSRYFEKKTKGMSMTGNYKKKLLIQSGIVALCLSAVSLLLSIGVVASRLSTVFQDLYYLISNTGYLLETAEIETAMHITKVARYFQSAVMPDVQKMMNLMVVYLFYQGMRILFDLRTRNMAVAGS